MKNTLAGSCLCGAIQFTLHGDPIYAAFCHCSECRKFSGSAFAAVAGFRRSELKFASSSTNQALGSFAKTPETMLHFCRSCGSSLYADKLAKGIVHVRLGTLDSPASVKVQAHVHVGSKASWFDIPDDGLPRFEASPPMPSMPHSSTVPEPILA